MTSLLEEHNNTYSVGLRFPLSTSFEADKKVFIMDYNTAIKSEFLKHLLENMGDEENKENYYWVYYIRNGKIEIIGKSSEKPQCYKQIVRYQ